MSDSILSNETVIKQYKPGANINITDDVISGKDWENEINAVREEKEDKLDYDFKNGKIATINGSALYTPNHEYSGTNGIVVDNDTETISISSINSWKQYSEDNGSIGDGYYIGKNNVTTYDSITLGNSNSSTINSGNYYTNNINEGYNNTIEITNRTVNQSVNLVQIGADNKIKNAQNTSQLIGYNIGSYNVISGEGINIGKSNQTSAFGIVIGQYGIADNGSIILDKGSSYATNGSFSIGYSNHASNGSLTIGDNNSATYGSYVAGTYTNADYGSTAFGYQNSANGGSLIAGQNNSAVGGSTAIGQQNSANNGSVVLGVKNNVIHSYIMGDWNSAGIVSNTMNDSKIIGNYNSAEYSCRIIGNNNSAQYNSTVIGNNGYSNGGSLTLHPNSMAAPASANGGSIAIATNNSGPSIADGGSITIGNKLSAQGETILLGYNTNGNCRSIAIGYNSSATNGSFIFGGDATGNNLINYSNNGSVIIGGGGYGSIYCNSAVEGSVIVGKSFNGINYAGHASIVISQYGKTSADNESIAIGNTVSAINGSYVIGKNISGLGGFAFGRNAAVSDMSLVLNTSETSASATQGSLVLKACGTSYTSRTTSAACGSVVIGGNNFVTNASTAIGDGNAIQNWSIAFGNSNIAGFDNPTTLTTNEAYKGTHALILGYYNTVHNSYYGDPWYFSNKDGEYTKSLYTQNIVFGNYNRVNNHNSTVIGADNTIFSAVDLPYTPSYNTYSSITSVSAINEGFSVTFGRSNTIGNQFDFVQGKFNTLSGTNNMGYNTVFGSYNTLTNCKNNTVFGNNVILTNVSGQTVIGDYNEATDGVLVVSNGTSTTRSNAMLVSGDGTVSANKFITPDGDIYSLITAMSATITVLQQEINDLKS